MHGVAVYNVIWPLFYVLLLMFWKIISTYVLSYHRTPVAKVTGMHYITGTNSYFYSYT